MLSQHLIQRLIALVLALFSFSALAVAQSKQKGSTPPPDERARKIKSEAKDAYTRWPKDDVSVIIRPEEEAAYKKLKTDEEREAFIGEFWKLRDPDPDTEENEYREEHYERLTYANEHFSSGIPGQMTDRGRIYIKFGKPDEIESHPAGGPYQRLSYEGRGSTTTYPFEKWFYRHIPGVGSGVEIEFVDPSGSGEYRIARDFKEKEVTNTPGNSPGSELSYTREQDSPFARADLLRNLDKAPEIARKYLGSSTDEPKLDDNPLNFEIRADYFKLADNRVLTAFTIQAENRDLSFDESGGLLTAHLNIFGRIIGVTDRRVGSFEDTVTTTATVRELAEAQERRSAYSKVTILTPGNYRADVVVRDVKSGATGVRHFGFQVPRYEEGKLATSSMILAAKLENLEGLAATGQFVIGQTKVVPNLSGEFHRGQPVGVYLQLYNAGIDQTTLRPSVDVEYDLLRDGKVLRTQVEDWKGISDSGQRLTLARLLETKTLAPGNYEVAIRVHDGVSGQALAQSAKFTVVEK